MGRTGVGIVGAGDISAAYLRLAPLFAGLEMRAIADLNPDASARRADAFEIRQASVEELLAAGDIDVVVNLTIPAAHKEVTAAILEAGKHAYTEKPLALSSDDAVALAEKARQAGLRLGSAPDTFLGGAHQTARALLDGGAIGTVISGTTHIMGRGMEGWHPNPDFFFQPGAGPILDMGPYYVANLVQLLGPVGRVTAASRMAFAERIIGSEARRGERISVNTPTTFHALLEFQGGALITLGASWDVTAHRHGHMELYGTAGTLFLPDPNFFGGDVEVALPNGHAQKVSGSGHPFGAPNEERPGQPARANYRGAGLADMVAGLHEDRPHRCNGAFAAHCVEVMTAVLRAAHTGDAVTLRTTCERPAPLPAADAQALLA
ncbi:MAG: Gfo/Idh/MocA family oxidoreductase [Pseudomonadota bacterium]